MALFCAKPWNLVPGDREQPGAKPVLRRYRLRTCIAIALSHLASEVVRYCEATICKGIRPRIAVAA